MTLLHLKKQNFSKKTSHSFCPLYWLSFFNLWFQITSSIFSNDYFVVIKRLLRRHHQTITSSTSPNDYFVDIIKRLLPRHQQTITSSTSSNDYFVIIKRLLRRHHQTITSSTSSNDYFFCIFNNF